MTDPGRHAAWHALVLEQGGPPAVVDLVTLRAARGAAAEPAPPPPDPAGRRRAYAELRRTALAVLR